MKIQVGDRVITPDGLGTVTYDNWLGDYSECSASIAADEFGWHGQVDKLKPAPIRRGDWARLSSNSRRDGLVVYLSRTRAWVSWPQEELMPLPLPLADLVPIMHTEAP